MQFHYDGSCPSLVILATGVDNSIITRSSFLFISLVHEVDQLSHITLTLASPLIYSVRRTGRSSLAKNDEYLRNFLFLRSAYMSYTAPVRVCVRFREWFSLDPLYSSNCSEVYYLWPSTASGRAAAGLHWRVPADNTWQRSDRAARRSGEWVGQSRE